VIPQWRDFALCRDPSVRDLFLPPPGHEDREVRNRRQKAAKAICEGCQVRPACLQYAILIPATQRSAGVWAGATAHEIDVAIRDGDVERLDQIAHRRFE